MTATLGLQVASKFPNLKVNKASCRVCLHGFVKTFKVSSSLSLRGAAELADAYDRAARRYWETLSGFVKSLFCTCCNVRSLLVTPGLI